MTTDKQIEANKQNAIVSTGPKSIEGKNLVSQNAIKHGIFAKDLIISDGDGQENKQEYRELLEGLIASLNPAGQMECLLVEKIAVDFWRLRRVLRFETGSIRKFLDMAVHDYYNKKDCFGGKINKTNEDIDEELAEYRELNDKRSQKKIDELEKAKLKNQYAEDVMVKTNSLPAGDTYEKVIKYEKAVQRSILQNIALLKRIQSMR